MLSLDDILKELMAKASLSKAELMEKIHDKQQELSGLVSIEGAAHLVARDLGIDLLKNKEKFYKLKDIKPEMRNFNLKVRVSSITPVKTFTKKDGTEGRVCNLVVFDETGEARVPLWDKQIETIEESLKPGDVIQLKNISSRQNIFGGIELVLLKTSNIIKLEDDKSLPSTPSPSASKRIELKDATEGYFEIRAIIVDVFNTNPIFLSCPKCKSKVENANGEYICKTHGNVKPDANMIITGVLDDGTGTIRAVFFKDMAREISDIDVKALQDMTQEEAIKLIKENVLGKEFLFKGRIQKNKIFESLEFVASDVKEVDVLEESNRIMDELSELNE